MYLYVVVDENDDIFYDDHDDVGDDDVGDDDVDYDDDGD
jgi:hypothetical protein